MRRGKKGIPQYRIGNTVGTPRALQATIMAAGLAFLAPVSRGVDGWATRGGGTSGGSGGSTVTVSSLSSFKNYATGSTKYIIHVSGTINLGSSSFDIGSNKTIIGDGANSGFIGDLRAKRQSNLILQNLNFTNPNGVGDGDGLTLQYTTRYFVTHCTFFQCADGELDQSHACDYGTISWCKFSYNSNTGHNFVNLIGHSDSNASEDSGHLRITMHHNWYSTLCKERMPRVRFGQVHIYNNYYGASGSNYNIGIGNDCQILAQNNYFDGQSNPWKNYSSSEHQGRIQYSGNDFVNCSRPTWAPNSSAFTPPYSYSPDNASSVKSIVTASAGTSSSSSGSGSSSSNGGSALNVELESLSGQDSFSPFSVQSDSSASGGQYIVWPGSGGQLSSASDGTSGQIAIDFTLSQAANVKFEIRVNMDNPTDDSFFYKVDSGSWYTQNNTQTSGWGILNPTTFNNLSAGSHTLYIERREDGTKLDKVTLTASSGSISGGSSSSSGSSGSSSSSGSASVANGTYKLINRNSGKAMDASGRGTANGTQIIQWNYGGSSNQKWTLTDRGNGQYSIIGVQSGKGLDITGKSTSNGATVQLYDYWGGSNQKFTITSVGSGYYRISPTSATDNCLDVSGWSTADGAKVIQWAYGATPNQQWALQSP